MNLSGSSEQLQRLIGLVVADAIFLEDVLALNFKSADQLAIYNNFTLNEGENVCSPEKLFLLQGLAVCEYKMTSNEIQIFFSKSMILTIDVSDKAFNGPEAMQLSFADGTIVIWS